MRQRVWARAGRAVEFIYKNSTVPAGRATLAHRMQWPWRARLRRRVLVNLKDDATQALRGVLWNQRGRWFVLRQADLLKLGAEPTPLDGEVIVHVTNIAFYQELP